MLSLAWRGARTARQALSGSGDKTVRVWDVASGRCLRVLEGHSGRCLERGVERGRPAGALRF